DSTRAARACGGQLADRARAGVSRPRGRRGAGATVLEVPTGPAQGGAGHQFPFRGAPVPKRALPDPGLAFLRVYGDQAAEIEVEVHQSGRGLVLLRWTVALDAR